mmetsp:Transcript_15286/g.37511  ORF Transcript_15286/g.37511 Transcript_15286/m.37511 type:complete len:98 (-) Transcript_15286:1-294(-)
MRILREEHSQELEKLEKETKRDVLPPTPTLKSIALPETKKNSTEVDTDQLASSLLREKQALNRNIALVKESHEEELRNYLLTTFCPTARGLFEEDRK